MFFTVFPRLLGRTQLGNSENKKGSHTNEKNSRNKQTGTITSLERQKRQERQEPGVLSPMAKKRGAAVFPPQGVFN